MRAWTYCAGLALTGLLAASCFAQSVDDAARQERERKSHIATPARVYTNDDIPSRAPLVAPLEPSPKKEKPDEPTPAAADEPAPPTAGQVRATVLAQKQKIRDLQARLAEIQKQLDVRAPVGTVGTSQVVALPASAGPGFCTTIDAMNTPPTYNRAWCDEGLRLLDEQATDQARLQQEQSVLEDMQEEARRLGFRSTVYDPD